MGAQLVRAAYVFGAEHALKPNEMRLLAFMALTALDGDARPRYFASRETSAFALGRRVPDLPDYDEPDFDAIELEREAAFKRVSVATSGLVRAGAIASLKAGREGQRAEYRLLLRGTENVPLGRT